MTEAEEIVTRVDRAFQRARSRGSWNKHVIEELYRDTCPELVREMRELLREKRIQWRQPPNPA